MPTSIATQSPGEHLVGRAVAEPLARAAVEQRLDPGDALPCDAREVSPLREELSQQAVRVLVRAALPRPARGGEVDRQAQRRRDLRVAGELLAIVQRQRPAKRLGEARQ